MPCALVKSAGAPTKSNASRAREEERRASHHESDRGVETQSLDDTTYPDQYDASSEMALQDSRGEEGVERACGQMEVLHQTEHPCPLIATSLLQALHRGGRAIIRISRLVLLHAAMREFLLAVVEPPGSEWCVWEEDEAKQSYDSSDCALDDEEPPPACDATHTVHASEDAGSNESG